MSRNNQDLIARALVNYQNPTATKDDVCRVLAAYRSLGYAVKPFVFNDGTTKDLFTLSGTIPVVFKNNTYYIPIVIWLMDTHPNNAPMCFVDPTPLMQIKVSMYVDHTGKIYLPYLHDWQPQTSDLLALIQVLIVTFGDTPPVFTKPTPTKQGPCYPTNAGYMPKPQSVPNGAGNSYLPYTPATVANAFPPYPTGNNFPPYPPGNNFPSSGANGGAINTGYPQYTNFPQVPGYNTNYSPSNASSTGTITEEHIKASLISAVEEKFRRRIEEKVNQYQAEIETLQRTNQELTEGSMRIDKIITRLECEEKELKQVITTLIEKEQECENSLKALENSEDIKPDDVVTTTAPLYKQLLNSCAEAAASEDAIYYLGEALRSGVIDTETFLKKILQQSRKQFFLVATTIKCREKAGLRA